MAVASHRQVRPISLGKAKAGVKQPACPFCPGGAEGLNGPYEFAVFENKFPSFNRNSDAPSLGKPVLVMRETTERPEGITAGNACLVGVKRERIVDKLRQLLWDPEKRAAMAAVSNPYGDGRAAGRIVDVLANL